MESRICEHFKVSSLNDFNPYPKDGIPIWKAARQHTFTVHLKNCKPGPLLVPPSDQYQPKNLFEGRPVNLGDVSCKAICINHVQNTSGHYWIRRGYYPVFDVENAKDRRQIAESAGFDPRMPDNILEVPPNYNQVIVEHVYPENPNCLFLNDACIKTFMLMTKDILMRGICKLPFDDEGYNVLIPSNHVLSWALNFRNEFREQRGLFAWDIHDKFYLVKEETFQKLFKECCDEFLGKIDRRPLGQVGIELHEEQKSSSVGPNISFSVTYIGYPQIPNPPPCFLPILHPDFPPYVIRLENEAKFKQIQEEQDMILKLNKK